MSSTAVKWNVCKACWMTQVLLIDSGASKNSAIQRALRSAVSIHRYGKKQRSNWNSIETVNWTDEHHNKSRETVLGWWRRRLSLWPPQRDSEHFIELTILEHWAHDYKRDGDENFQLYLCRRARKQNSTYKYTKPVVSPLSLSLSLSLSSVSFLEATWSIHNAAPWFSTQRNWAKLLQHRRLQTKR